MRVQFFCPLWGCEDIAFDKFARNVKTAGYDGVEMSFSSDQNETKHLIKIIKDEGLELIAQHWQTRTSDFNVHKVEYENLLRNLAGTNPLFINSQTGKDFFSFEQNAELIELAKSISDETGVKIIHETHRGKFSFAAHVTKQFLQHFDDLRLTLDISHWCNVAESMLDGQEEAVSMALSRTDHIHSRVGFEEGPQIPDPRVEDWSEAVEHHLTWWDKVIENAKNRKQDCFTITSEFGPQPYMQIDPVSKKPLANQWDVNVYMKDLLTKRYNEGR